MGLNSTLWIQYKYFESTDSYYSQYIIYSIAYCLAKKFIISWYNFSIRSFKMLSFCMALQRELEISLSARVLSPYLPQPITVHFLLNQV